MMQEELLIFIVILIKETIDEAKKIYQYQILRKYLIKRKIIKKQKLFKKSIEKN